MRPQEIIAKKRDGGVLSAAEFDIFVEGVCNESWADYQISALLMAMFIRGLDGEEQDRLTYAMLHSGDVLDLSGINAPKADKHSTGGVGDKTSLIIAPLAAACGLAVPMVSGRGLGHTGGTLDKLESIPGYNVNLSKEDFKSIVKECGFAMAGQTADIAPADKKLYALRDATATVPYIPLIVASIMSKKLAEGLDVLVLDVKTGSGAFMRELEDSRDLARALVETGRKFGVKTEAVMSDMNQPLGRWVGNSCEVYECIEILRGSIDTKTEPTWELSCELTARMVLNAGLSDGIDDARLVVKSKLSSGEALQIFQKNIGLQGGDTSVCDEPQKLLAGQSFELAIEATGTGYVADVDCLSIGNAISSLGGGRTKADDVIDHAVGYANEVKIGEKVEKGQPLGFLYCRTPDQAVSINEQLKNAYRISGELGQSPRGLIVDTVS